MATTFVDYTGDGNATKQFTFPSIQESDIKVKVDEVIKSSGTHYNITNYTTTGGGDVVFTSGNIPTSPSVILIYRDTNVDTAKATYTAGASVKAGDLNANHEQVLFALQEEQNQLERISDIEDGSIDSAKIKNDTIVNIDVNSAAAIDGTKISPDFGSQNIATTGTAATGALTVTGSITVSGTVDSRDLQVDGNKLDGIETGATADQTASEIRSLVESASDSNVFTDADHTKLNGIETAATADQTAAEIRTLVEDATDSNVFTDADHTKLDGIETGATADQTAAEIRALVESATDSNVFTDADHTKLNGLGSLNALSDVNTAGVANDKILKYDSSVSQFIIADASTGELGSTTFTGLNDTPVNFGSAAGKVIKVNAGETALEFSDADVVADTTPQLGGNLDVQAREINTSTTNGNIKLTPNGTGVVEIKGNTEGGSANVGTLQLNCQNNSHGVKIESPPHSANANYTLTLPITAGSDGQALKTNGTGTLSFGNVISAQTEIISLYDQTSPTPVQRLLASSEGVTVQGTSTAVSKLMFRDRTTSNLLKFKPVDTLPATVEFTLPSADGTFGRFLKTDGSGVLDFSSTIYQHDGSSNAFGYGAGDIIIEGDLESGSSTLTNDDVIHFDKNVKSLDLGRNVDLTFGFGAIRSKTAAVSNQVISSTSSFIISNGASGGDILINPSVGHLSIGSADNVDKEVAHFQGPIGGSQTDGFVRLRHCLHSGSSSTRLETTSTGVSVTGALVASGDVTAFSDARLKTDIHTINNALGIVGQLRGVSYKWLKDGKPSIGVIAQEVEEVIPEVVLTTEHEGKEVKSVDYGKMVGVLINAINELKAEVEELKNAKITG